MSTPPLDFLAQAKDLLSAGQTEAALHALGQWHATTRAIPYTLCRKAAQLTHKIAAQAPQGSFKPLKVALLSSASTVFIEPLLKHFALLKGLLLEVRSGDFGNWRQDMLNPKSWLYAFAPHAVIIAPHYRDAALPPLSAEPEQAAHTLANDMAACWQTLAGRMPAAIIQLTFDSPDCDAAGYLGHNAPATRPRVLAAANALLCQLAAKQGVVLLDVDAVRAAARAGGWEDARLWHHARQHPAPEALPALARAFARALAACFLPSKKVCVVDLDNTLWGGVVGEDGLDGLVLGAPDPAGEAFADFQSYLGELRARGVLLAVCSKNNEADAGLPFEKHPAMRLKREDFAVFCANWLPKSHNIAQIARQLNVGLESLVFVDENPAEIAEAKAALPQLKCVQLPRDPADYIAALDGHQCFDTTAVSADDLKRNAAYTANTLRESARAQTANVEDFLASLQMRCTVSKVAENLARAAQLLERTNQFNLTTRRHSAQALAKLAESPGAFARCFSLSDRFGDNGLVGVLIALAAEEGVLEIDSFAISCRAIGRGLEYTMRNTLLAFAKASAARAIRGVYLPTQKNAQTAELYTRLGFRQESASPERSSWLLDVSHAAALPTFIAED